MSSSRRCTTSDREGRFALEAVEAGELTLSAAAAGFIAETRSLRAPASREVALVLVLKSGGATLAGVVTDALGGPISGAVVVARDDTSRILAALVTGARGEFHFEVAAGPLTLEANAEAYTRHALSVTAPAPAVSIVLSPASAILGRVEVNGVPAQGARVLAAPADGPEIGAKETESDASGAFALSELPAGRYELTAQRADSRSDAVWVELVVGQPSALTILRLAQAASLSATVRVAGEPCTQGRLNLSGPLSRSEPITDAGAVRVDAITPGQYELEIACETGAPHRESIELGTGLTTRDFNLELGRELRGRVEDASGHAVAGAWLDVQPTRAGAASKSCSTDRAGEFTCGGLEASEYDCSVRSALGLLSEKARVDLTRSAVSHLTLRLAASASIRVKLARADALHSARVFAQEKEGAIGPAVGSGEEFVFERLPLGEYKVFMGAGTAAPAESSTLVSLERDGEVARVTLSPPALADIGGVVVDSAGNPVIETWVRAANTNALLGVYADTPAAAITDDQGRFRLSGLIPGRYDICTRCDTEAQRVTGIEAGASDVVLRVSTAPPSDERATP